MLLGAKSGFRNVSVSPVMSAEWKDPGGRLLGGRGPEGKGPGGKGPMTPGGGRGLL